MQRKRTRIVVIGTSAGGLEALDQLIGQLPQKFTAPIFIVQHMTLYNSGQPLVRRLLRHRAFDVRLARNGERFAAGRIYIAPPDHHLLLKRDRMLVTRGARENRNRPGIDPLFRSAAVAHRALVVGVILTGLLDDGTAGLRAIKRCGGVTVVQDPNDAAYGGMPQSALDNVAVDYCVPIAEMGALLTTLVARRPGKSRPAPADVQVEARIAERVMSDIGQLNGLGVQVPYNCPNCGGVLWKLDTDGNRYRCHTGHSFTADALLAGQSEKIEEMLWISLRMFEERKNLLNSMLKTPGHSSRQGSTRQRAKEAQVYIDRIRAMLLGPGPHDAADTLTHVKGLMAEPQKARSTR